jgi:hypothetical protein
VGIHVRLPKIGPATMASSVIEHGPSITKPDESSVDIQAMRAALRTVVGVSRLVMVSWTAVEYAGIAADGAVSSVIRKVPVAASHASVPCDALGF